jgi:hypothetical protein
MRTYESQFLTALAFTVLIETVVIFFAIRRLLNLRGPTPAQIVYAGLVANVSSLPYLWFVLPAYLRNYSWYLVVGELGVVLWEAVFYWMYLSLRFREAATLSVSANFASFLFGLVLFKLIWTH